MKSYLEKTRIKDYPYEEKLPDALGMVKALVDDYETIIREIGEDLKT